MKAQIRWSRPDWNELWGKDGHRRLAQAVRSRFPNDEITFEWVNKRFAPNTVEGDEPLRTEILDFLWYELTAAMEASK